MLEQALLAGGILNTKDLKYVAGVESGSPLDYLLNVWCWDAFLFLHLVASVPSFIVGICLLLPVPVKVGHLTNERTS